MRSGPSIPAVLVVAGVVAALAGGCAHTVAQDARTGADGKQRGARPLVLVDGEARVRDIVTYPGGDRVDWKRIDLPAGARGTLEVRMTYATPRPGLRVTFDVFDQWNARLASAGLGRAPRHVVTGARGTYFVRVYAPRRTDAGAYRLTAAFTPDPPPPPSPADIDVPPPPKLAAVPEPPPTCEVFDAKNPACKTACAPGTPPQWTGCPPPSVVAAPVPTTAPPAPPPAPSAAPVTARVLAYVVDGDALVVTIGAGSEVGVSKGWRVTLLRGTDPDTAQPLPGGAGTLVRIDRRRALVRLEVTPDQLRDNPLVQLAP